jgi:Amt family ammonium transporter
MAQSFAIACLVTVIWVLVGYSLAFTEKSPCLGGTSRFALDGLLHAKGGR